jgi:GDSL-like lipase/acylhydrolase family protein
MRLLTALIVTIAVNCLPAWGAVAEPQPDACDVPASLLESEIDLTRATNELKDKHRLDISVLGTGSSSLAGPDGAHFAYPARLEDALKQQLPGNEIKLTAHVQPKQITANMLGGLDKILAEDHPALVIWQAGTADAINGIEIEDFRSSLEEGVDKIQAAGADVILMNMQYSPRTASMLDVSAYADVMRHVAQQRNALLFDRLAIMQYWNDTGTFDLYAATTKYDMARRVHECIGRALASQIIGAAHLDAVRMQTTR